MYRRSIILGSYNNNDQITDTPRAAVEHERHIDLLVNNKLLLILHCHENSTGIPPIQENPEIDNHTLVFVAREPQKNQGRPHTKVVNFCYLNSN